MVDRTPKDRFAAPRDEILPFRPHKGRYFVNLAEWDYRGLPFCSRLFIRACREIRRSREEIYDPRESPIIRQRGNLCDARVFPSHLPARRVGRARDAIFLPFPCADCSMDRPAGRRSICLNGQWQPRERTMAAVSRINRSLREMAKTARRDGHDGGKRTPSSEPLARNNQLI